MAIPVKLGKLNESSASAQLVEFDNGLLKLAEPGNVYLDINPLDVVSLSRSGNSLIVKTTSGDLTIENYFASDPAQSLSKLFIHDNSCEYLMRVKTPADGMQENLVPDYELLDDQAPFESLTCPVAHLDPKTFQPTVLAASSMVGLLPLGILGGGALAAVAIANDDGGNDNPPPPALTVAVADAIPVTEGESLVFNITVTGVDTLQTVPFSIAGSNITPQDYGTLAFSNGVTLSQDGMSLIIPANVTSFSVTVPASVDAVIEGPEALVLTVGADSGTGMIVDETAQLVRC